MSGHPIDRRVEIALASLLEEAHDYIVAGIENLAMMNDETTSLLRRIEDALNMPASMRITDQSSEPSIMTCMCGDSECPSCGLLQGTLTTCHCCGERPAIAGEELCHRCRDNEGEAAYDRYQERCMEDPPISSMSSAGWRGKRRGG